MNAPHRHSGHSYHSHAAGWMKEAPVLSALAALLAFGVIYVYSGETRLLYAILGGLGMGVVIYFTAKMPMRRKPIK